MVVFYFDEKTFGPGKCMEEAVELITAHAVAEMWNISGALCLICFDIRCYLK